MEQPRGDDGQFVSLREFVTMLLDQRIINIEEKFRSKQQALELQALEYERRLTDLNHAHARAQEVQHTYVTQAKYEEKLESDEKARKLALNRLDEQIRHLDETMTNKLDDYITRYEARQRDVDVALAAGKGAAQEAKRAAEEQGRKNNRNIGIASIALAIIIAIANWLGIA